MIKIPEQLTNLFSQADEKKRNIAIGVAAFLILAIDFLLIMRPQISRLMFLNQEVSKRKTDFKAANDDIAKVAQYRSDVHQWAEKISSMNEKIKSREEVPLILERISLMANQQGVKINQIMPNQDGQKAILKNSEVQYYLLPIFVEAYAGYHDLGRFLNQLESDEMYLRLDNFTLSANGGDIYHHQMQMTIQAIIFDKTKVEKK